MNKERFRMMCVIAVEMMRFGAPGLTPDQRAAFKALCHRYGAEKALYIAPEDRVPFLQELKLPTWAWQANLYRHYGEAS